MWIKIKRKFKDFDPGSTDLKFIEDEHYINLDRVEDIVIGKDKITVNFREDNSLYIISTDTKNFEEVKRLIEKGFAINLKET